MAAIPDCVYPDTRGERPADLDEALKVGLALNKLAAHDPAVHKLMAEVQHLLKPRSVYQDPELMQRVRTSDGRRIGTTRGHAARVRVLPMVGGRYGANPTAHGRDERHSHAYR